MESVKEGNVVTTNISSAQISEPFEYENGYRASVEKVEGVSQVTLSNKEKDDYFKDGVINTTKPSDESTNKHDGNNSASQQEPTGEVDASKESEDKGFFGGIVDGVKDVIDGIFGSDEDEDIEYTDDLKIKPSTTNTVKTEHGTLEVQKDVYEGNTVIYTFWTYDESGQRVEVSWEELGDYIEVFTVLENGADDLDV